MGGIRVAGTHKGQFEQWDQRRTLVGRYTQGG